MNKKLSRQSRSSVKSAVSNDWTGAENFNFGISSSPTRKKSGRATLSENKKGKEKAPEKSTLTGRRKSVYLKRLESEFGEDVIKTPSPRRTRRGKSFSNISSTTKSRKDIPRVKSEKTIHSKHEHIKMISPTIKLHKLRDAHIQANKSGLVEEDKKPSPSKAKLKRGRPSTPRVKQMSPGKNVSPPKTKASQVTLKTQKSIKIEKEVANESEMKNNSINKDKFYGSPKGNQSLVRKRRSMVEMLEVFSPPPKKFRQGARGKSQAQEQTLEKKKSVSSSSSVNNKNARSKVPENNHMSDSSLQSVKQSKSQTQEQSFGRKKRIPSHSKLSSSSSVKKNTHSKVSKNNCTSSDSSLQSKIYKKSLPRTKSEPVSEAKSSISKEPESKSSKAKKSPKATKTPSSVSKQTLKKSIKRIGVSTPSPVRANNKRLTRSSIRKAVYIKAKSPQVTRGAFRKTPKSHEINSFLKTLEDHKSFTPKPQEPSKILKQTLKKNIAAEMKAMAKNDVSSLLRPSIASIRTPKDERTSVKSEKIEFHSSEKATTPGKSILKTSPPKRERTALYNLPSTPVSTRKSSVSFKRSRAVSRLTTESPTRANISSSFGWSTNFGDEKPLSSTPMRRKNLEIPSSSASASYSVNDASAEYDLANISEFSTAATESSKLASYSESKSFLDDDSEVYSDASSMDDDVEVSISETSKTSAGSRSPESQQKKGYCSLM